MKYHPRAPLGKQIAADIAAITRGRVNTGTGNNPVGRPRNEGLGVYADRGYLGQRGTKNGHPL